MGEGKVVVIKNGNPALGTITEVVAGDGTVGGGIADSVTIDVVGGEGITVNPDNIEINKTSVLGWQGQQFFEAVLETETTNTLTWDLNTEQVKIVTLEFNGDTNINTPTNQQAGSTYILILKQGVNTTTVSWDSTYKFPGGAAPSMSDTLNDVDIVTFISDGTSMYGVAQQKFA